MYASVAVVVMAVIGIVHLQGAHIVFVAIVAAFGEAPPAANAMLFPTEATTGLALNLQAWLSKPQWQSPRHCSPGQRVRCTTDLRGPP